MKFRDVLLALITPILLGFGFAIAKPAMEQFPPFLLMGLRFTIAALILIWWFPIPKVFLKKIFFVSLIGGTLTYGLVYSGFNRIDASSFWSRGGLDWIFFRCGLSRTKKATGIAKII